MKRSQHVTIGIVATAAAAALAAGCGSASGQSQGWQTCVDSSKRRVEDQQCVDDQRRSYAGGGSYVPIYHWYYFPHGGYPMPMMGATMPAGGSMNAAPVSGSAARSGAVSVSRGGFGGIGSGSVGG